MTFICRIRLGLLLFLAPFVALAPQARADGSIFLTLPNATQGRDLVVGPDSAVWFNGAFGSEHPGWPWTFIARIGADGKAGVYPLPKGVEAGAPVSGPKASVWFPENREQGQHLGVGRMSSPGKLRQYGLPGRGSIEAMAASGSDLWIAANLANRRGEEVRSVVERVSTSPRVSVTGRIALKPSCSSSASGIAAGGGVVWFVETCANPEGSGSLSSLVRIGLTGDMTGYGLLPESYVESLALSPDGTLWFGNFRNGGTENEFGRITPAGDLASYRVDDSDPGTAAVGPEGRLWFRSSFGDSVYSGLRSIGIDGDLGETVCAGPKCKLEAEGLTTGPDGDLWFSATEAHAPYGGGGGGALIEGEWRANEAGVIGRLAP